MPLATRWLNRSRTAPDSVVTTALPAQNSAVTSAGLDLQSGHKNLSMDLVDVVVSVPATPNLANAQTLSFQLMDSADNATFAAIAGESPDVVTGAGGVGAAAATFNHSLPTITPLKPSVGVRRWLAVQISASATAGNNTAVSATLQLLY